MLVGLSIVVTTSVLMVLITRRTVWDFLIATSLVLMAPGASWFGHRIGHYVNHHEVMAAVGRVFQDWADIIDMLTLHPKARRQVVRSLCRD